MLKFLGLLLLTVAAAWPQSPLSSAQLNGEEKQALQFVNQAEQELLEATREFVKIQWAYASNITDYNEQKQLEYTVSNQTQNRFECMTVRLSIFQQDLNSEEDGVTFMFYNLAKFGEAKTRWRCAQQFIFILSFGRLKHIKS